MSRAREVANFASTGVTSAELDKLDGFTGTVDDLNYAKDLRATGVTNTEFDYLDGVGSNLQTQLDAKQATITTGISNTNVLVANANVADDDFLRVDGTSIEGRTAAETLGDIGAAPVASPSFSGTVSVGSGTLDVSSGTLTTSTAQKQAIVDGATISSIPSGMIAPMGMSSAPSGWLACDGSAVSRSTYATLFSAIGTTWGAGDGSSTFALPDLEGAFLRGTGANGTHNMAKGTDFEGPSVGSFENDQMQDHKHNGRYAYNSALGTASNQSPSTNGANAGSAHQNILEPIENSSQGTPRVGDETRPFNAGVKYCIKF